MVPNTHSLGRSPWILSNFNLDLELTIQILRVCKRSNLFLLLAPRLELQRIESKCQDQGLMISNHQYKMSHHLNLVNLSDLNWQAKKRLLDQDVKNQKIFKLMDKIVHQVPHDTDSVHLIDRIKITK